MIIERTKKEVIIRLPLNIDTNGLQNFVDYISYKSATSESKARQTDIDLLSKEVKIGWWTKNKSRLVE